DVRRDRNGAPMSDTQNAEATEAPQDAGQATEAKQQEHAFTQADVDRIVADRLKREREKFADYDDLKTKAGQATTLEERVALIEQAARDADQRAIRAEVANAKGLTPSQAKRLVGTT